MQKVTVRNICPVSDLPVKGPQAENQGVKHDSNICQEGNVGKGDMFGPAVTSRQQAGAEAAAHHERAVVHAAAHLSHSWGQMAAQSSRVSPAGLRERQFLSSSGSRSVSVTHTVLLLVAARPKYNKTERKTKTCSMSDLTTEKSWLEYFQEQLNANKTPNLLYIHTFFVFSVKKNKKEWTEET